MVNRTLWPSVFTHGTGEYTWRATDEPIYEYACHEGNYALPAVLRGARVAEAEEAAKER